MITLFQTYKVLSLGLLLSFFSLNLKAQDVDEILNTYYENTGGLENWKKLEGIRINAVVNQGGLEIPVESVILADGRQYTKITFQGNSIKQQVYDGENLWSTNFQTMKAEKADAETAANFKLEINDFPDDFINYQAKGYTVELMGTEPFEGTDTYKIKLQKEPVTVDGEEVENIEYYYFDKEAMVPIAEESAIKQGPNKGAVQVSKSSDYQEVDGLYFPFSINQSVKGGAEGASFVVKSYELNPEVDDSEFAFPEEN